MPAHLIRTCEIGVRRVLIIHLDLVIFKYGSYYLMYG